MVSVVNGELLIYGKPLLTQVPGSVNVVDATTKEWWDAGNLSQAAAFLGATFPQKDSRHVFPIGRLREHRFVCCFRFRLWWMAQRMGTLGREVPVETQFLLLESTNSSKNLGSESEEDTVYTIFLPLLEGQFRASLQGNEKDELEVCLESGDPAIQATEARYSVYIHAGPNPFEVISESLRAVEAHLESFRCRQKKKMPGMLDWFGWCTWNAFYTEVTADGIIEGIKSLISGGTPPRFVIIDDGWQTVAADQEADEPVINFKQRLLHLRENHKFRGSSEDPSLGLQRLVQKLKEECSLKFEKLRRVSY